MENGVIYVLSVLAAVAFSSFAMYDSERARASRTAMGIILLAALAVPFINTVRDATGILTENLPTYEGEEDNMSATVAKEAYLRGIRLAVADEFSLSEEDIRVECSGFSFEKMRAERVHITLFGRAVLADIKAIGEYAEKSGFGECEVSISFE